MTVEGRAKRYQEKIEENNPQAEAYGFDQAYHQGAMDEREVCIEKACELCCEICGLEVGDMGCMSKKDQKEGCGKLRMIKERLREE